MKNRHHALGIRQQRETHLPDFRPLLLGDCIAIGYSRFDKLLMTNGQVFVFL
jgi:hypothetical protein